MDPLRKQSINIDIAPEGDKFSIDFIGCSLGDAYRIMKHIVEGMESGEFFDNDLAITDTDGNLLDGNKARAVIQGIKEEMESN